MKRLVVPSTTRHPRARLLINGSAMPGLLSCNVSTNSHYRADTFSAALALNAPGGEDLVWWGADERKGALADIRITLDGLETKLIVGEIDDIEIHVEMGEVRLKGRDLTARFKDHRTQEAFQNRTSSEIVTTLAQRRGLTPVVTATTTPVDRFYGADHDRVQHDQRSHVSTEWDLMVWLAQQEGFDLFVIGTSLYFQPTTDISKTEPYGVHWNADARRSEIFNIQVKRSLTLAKDISVVVRSWNSAQGRAFSRTSPAGSGNASVESGKVHREVVTRPNLTEDQAQKLADQLREEWTKHERVLTFDCPGELSLTPRDIISLVGCGGWDQRYYISSISRKLSLESGFKQTVSCKNSSVDSQAIV